MFLFRKSTDPKQKRQQRQAEGADSFGYSPGGLVTYHAQRLSRFCTPTVASPTGPMQSPALPFGDNQLWNARIPPPPFPSAPAFNFDAYYAFYQLLASLPPPQSQNYLSSISSSFLAPPTEQAAPSQAIGSSHKRPYASEVGPGWTAQTPSDLRGHPAASPVSSPLSAEFDSSELSSPALSSSCDVEEIPFPRSEGSFNGGSDVRPRMERYWSAFPPSQVLR